MQSIRKLFCLLDKLVFVGFHHDALIRLGHGNMVASCVESDRHVDVYYDTLAKKYYWRRRQ